MKTPANLPIHTRSTGRHPHQGFTLVELMVVIAIIAVLVLLSFAQARRMRDMAYQANALASIRQVATACAAYSVENNGDIDVLRDDNDKLVAKAPGNLTSSFWGVLQPYLFPNASNSNMTQLLSDMRVGLNQLLNTPNCDTMIKTSISGVKLHHDTSGLPVPFGFNSNPLVHTPDQTMKIGGITDSFRMIHFTFGSLYIDANAGKTYVPLPTDGKTLGNSILFLPTRNALASFLDGHVELLKAPIDSRKFK